MEYEALRGKNREESSAAIRERVCRARDIQKSRYRELGISTNSMLGMRELEKYCVLGKKEEELMKQAFSRLGLTARTYHKMLKVARTIADLEGEPAIREAHVQEAICFRVSADKFWK